MKSFSPENFRTPEIERYHDAAGTQAKSLAGRAAHVGLNTAAHLLPAVVLFGAFQLLGKGFPKSK